MERVRDALGETGQLAVLDSLWERQLGDPSHLFHELTESGVPFERLCDFPTGHPKLFEQPGSYEPDERLSMPIPVRHL
jgi:hypothetical protein